MLLELSGHQEKKYGEDDYRTGWVDGVDSNSNSEDDPDRLLDSDSDLLDEIESEEQAAVAALVPARTKQGVDETTVRRRKWTTDEDSAPTDECSKEAQRRRLGWYFQAGSGSNETPVSD
jgi:hypothetical protein